MKFEELFGYILYALPFIFVVELILQVSIIKMEYNERMNERLAEMRKKQRMLNNRAIKRYN